MSTPAFATAFITGACSTLGRALCTKLQAAGTDVWIADSDLEALQAVGRTLGVPAERIVALDVTEADAFKRAVSRAAESGGIDLLINGARAELAGEFSEFTSGEASRALSVEIAGALNGAMAVWPLMESKGKGAIVNITGASGLVPVPLQAAQSAASQGLMGLTMALRMEGEQCGIDVMGACMAVGGDPGAPGVRLKGWVDLVTFYKLKVLWLPEAMALDPEEAAEEVLRGLSLGRSMVVAPRALRWAWLAHRVSPLWWLSFTTRWLNRARRRAG